MIYMAYCEDIHNLHLQQTSQLCSSLQEVSKLGNEICKEMADSYGLEYCDFDYKIYKVG